MCQRKAITIPFSTCLAAQRDVTVCALITCPVFLFVNKRTICAHTSGINDSEMYMKHAWYIINDQDLTDVRTDYPEQRLNKWEDHIPMNTFMKQYFTPNSKLYSKDPK